MSVDPLAPLEGENLTAYLQRTRPQYTWTDDEGNAEPSAYVELNTGVENFFVTLRARLSRAEWALYVAQVYPPPPPLQAVAPVWPGLDKVTLGEPLALSNGLVITGPLDGLIFAITRDSAGGGRWQFGEVSSWNNVGAVMFETDGGSFERAITIGIDTQVVVPLTMVRAAGAVVRFANPFSGTVTPWTITGT